MITTIQHYRVINNIAHAYSNSSYTVYGSKHKRIEDDLLSLKDLIKEFHGLEVEVIESTRKLVINVNITHNHVRQKNTG